MSGVKADCRRCLLSGAEIRYSGAATNPSLVLSSVRMPLSSTRPTCFKRNLFARPPAQEQHLAVGICPVAVRLTLLLLLVRVTTGFTRTEGCVRGGGDERRENQQAGRSALGTSAQGLQHQGEPSRGVSMGDSLSIVQ